MKNIILLILIFQSCCLGQAVSIEKDESVSDLNFIYKVLMYFKLDKGRMPESTLELGSYASKSRPELDFWNVARNTNGKYGPNIPPYYYLYSVNDVNPKNKGETEYYYYTDVEASFILDGESYRDQGYYITLDEKGDVSKVPFDEVNYYYTDPRGNNAVLRFPGQINSRREDLLSYSEYRSNSEDVEYFPVFTRAWKPKSNDTLIEDNNGPEALLIMSRRMKYLSSYGISREELWSSLDPSKAQFTLADIQLGAKKLGLDLSIKEKQSLVNLQESHTPALLFLQDDGRIVTLTALDDDRAVVIDRGVTQNVERSVLEKRYSGEALVPTKALTQNTAIVADDAVRELKLPTLDAEVPQQFVLRNMGTTPITLQLEYPLLGVTESKLSRDVIPPGETATLDLKVKWRSVLKAPYQNVLVSIQTNDPIVPRLQLAILLTPPAKTGN